MRRARALGFPPLGKAGSKSGEFQWHWKGWRSHKSCGAEGQGLCEKDGNSARRGSFYIFPWSAGVNGEQGKYFPARRSLARPCL